MSRSRLAVVALVFTAGVAVYGMVTNPEPMCAPAGVASATPPGPDLSGNYRDGASYNC